MISNKNSTSGWFIEFLEFKHSLILATAKINSNPHFLFTERKISIIDSFNFMKASTNENITQNFVKKNYDLLLEKYSKNTVKI